MLFGILADAADDSAELGAQAIDVVRRTNNGILDSVGIGGLLPTPVRDLADNAYNVPQNLVLGVGHSSANILRNIERFVDGEPTEEFQEERENFGEDSYNREDNEENADYDAYNEGYNEEQNYEKNEEDQYQHSGEENEESQYGDKDYNNDEYNSDDEDSENNTDNEDEDLDDGPGGANYNKRGHGARPDPVDDRDHIYEPTMAPTKTFIDLRGEYMPPVYDQGKMMSCTAHAVAGAFEFQTMRLHRQSLFSPSRLFLWYNARKAITTPTGSPDPQAVKKNIGTYIRDAIKSLKDKGVCSEEDWSYEVGEYNTKTLRFLNGAKAAMTPPKLAWNHALGHLATGETARKHASRLLATGTSYHRLNATETNIQPLKECLSKGHPVIFGMKTYGLLRGSAINDSGEGLPWEVPELQGGEARHSLLAVGYIERDEPKYNVIIVRNSWSERFGQKGYFYMPYPYLKLCYDFWILNLPQKIN